MAFIKPLVREILDSVIVPFIGNGDGAVDNLELENGCNLLYEDGGFILLE